MIIHTENLKKVYKQGKNKHITALENVSIEVERGEIFGFLGSNGAGKTTFIKILLGIVLPNEGVVKLFNQSISNSSIKNKIGYLPENINYPNYLTGKEFLNYYGRMSSLNSNVLKLRINNLIEMTNLDGYENKKIINYSKGIKQLLGIAQALINDPELLLLDEPTEGLDPIHRRKILEILKSLKKEGKTIFINSHLLSEIELVCDRVAIINKGKLLKIGKVQQLIYSMDKYRIKLNQNLPEDIKNILNKYPNIINGNCIEVTNGNIESVNMLIDYLRVQNIYIETIEKVQKTLEEIFFELIKE